MQTACKLQLLKSQSVCKLLLQNLQKATYVEMTGPWVKIELNRVAHRSMATFHPPRFDTGLP